MMVDEGLAQVTKQAYDLFKNSLWTVAEDQEKQLLQLVRANQRSEFGKRYGFKHIN